MREPILFCLCGPGASGKSTISRELLAGDSKLRLSISTTTRAPRGRERDGIEYFFVDEAEFAQRIQRGYFIEHAVFNGKRYGTEKQNIDRARTEGCDLLLDIDVQGAAQLKKLAPESTVTICVFPPSMDILKERFEKRGTEDSAKIAARLTIAKDEIATLRGVGFSDYFLLNDSIAEAVERARAIISAERMKFQRISREDLDRIFGA